LKTRPRRALLAPIEHLCDFSQLALCDRWLFAIHGLEQQNLLLDIRCQEGEVQEPCDARRRSAKLTRGLGGTPASALLNRALDVVRKR
jgi:hypothetical protein